MNEAIYRLAQPEDRASLLEFWIDAYTDSFPYIRRRHPREGFSDFYDTWVDKGNQFYVGMRESIVSMCAYKDGHIQHLYVSKSCQGQGVGSGMIRYIINLYRAPLYYLYVFRKNTEAIRLY
ncbi:MAG: GNAT family N-acetyltransferase [Verrucomicrobiota bacterium]